MGGQWSSDRSPSGGRDVHVPVLASHQWSQRVPRSSLPSCCVWQVRVLTDRTVATVLSTDGVHTTTAEGLQLVESLAVEARSIIRVISAGSSQSAALAGG